MTAYMRKAYAYNIQLQRTQQTRHRACSIYHVVNISGMAESGYSCIETNTMSQARRPFTLENLSFHNILPTKGLLTAVQQLTSQTNWGLLRVIFCCGGGHGRISLMPTTSANSISRSLPLWAVAHDTVTDSLRHGADTGPDNTQPIMS